LKNSDDGGYTASAVNFSIFTQGDNIDELKSNIRDAVLVISTQTKFTNNSTTLCTSGNSCYCMKIPRDISGLELSKLLKKLVIRLLDKPVVIFD